MASEVCQPRDTGPVADEHVQRLRQAYERFNQTNDFDWELIDPQSAS
jgi:hypothetical protein